MLLRGDYIKSRSTFQPHRKPISNRKGKVKLKVKADHLPTNQCPIGIDNSQNKPTASHWNIKAFNPQDI